MSIHKNYLLLTPEEKDLVDGMFGDGFNEGRLNNIPLDNSDPCERAVEAVATWVIESRPKPQSQDVPIGYASIIDEDGSHFNNNL